MEIAVVQESNRQEKQPFAEMAKTRLNRFADKIKHWVFFCFKPGAANQVNDLFQQSFLIGATGESCGNRKSPRLTGDFLLN